MGSLASGLDVPWIKPDEHQDQRPKNPYQCLNPDYSMD